jgi:chorismate mutase-like protein
METEAAPAHIGYLRRMTALPAEIVASRGAIDEIDHTIVELLARRRGLVADLFVHKRAFGLPMLDPARETALIDERCAYAERLGIPAEFVEVVFRAVLDDSHTLEPRD